ncbi:MAG: S8 family serine peptidase [Bacteriovoracaceae bacterium]|nr:S8 family serine peptidase [Bacteriovoracaceae bacterium]
MIRIATLLLLAAIICGCDNSIRKSLPKDPIDQGGGGQGAGQWMNLDSSLDGVEGAGVDRAYSELLKDKKATREVVVAIISDGLDIGHVDLKDRIWINKDEIKNDGVDNDVNGHIDDYYGWNFLGNDKLVNSTTDNLSLTRVYGVYQGVDCADAKYTEDQTKICTLAQTRYASEFKEIEDKYNAYSTDQTTYADSSKVLKDKLGLEEFTQATIESIESEDVDVVAAKAKLLELLKTYTTFDNLKGLVDASKELIDRAYNVSYDARQIVTGDDPDDLTQSKAYGNWKIETGNPVRGTHLAGIIGAIRENGEGMDGISEKVLLMGLRVRPEVGDTRDKDLLHAIKYAWSMGANIIVLDTGSEFSAHNEEINTELSTLFSDGKNDALIIQAAGDSASDIGSNYYFPNGSSYPNWITVGSNNKQKGSYLIFNGSNYAEKRVNLFAPGEQIISLTAGKSGIFDMSGSAQSAAVVAGVGAMILSYFDDLTNLQLKNTYLIGESRDYSTLEVKLPGSDSHDPYRTMIELCSSGGIVDAYQAIKEALSRK